MHFYLIPPTGNTLPLKVIYPVMARCSLGGILRRREARVVTMVTPAEGPSFLVDPSGKWMCKEISSRYFVFYRVVSYW